MSNGKLLGIGGLVVFYSMIVVVTYAIVYIGQSGIDIVLAHLASF